VKFNHSGPPDDQWCGWHSLHRAAALDQGLLKQRRELIKNLAAFTHRAVLAAADNDVRIAQKKHLVSDRASLLVGAKQSFDVFLDNRSQVSSLGGY